MRSHHRPAAAHVRRACQALLLTVLFAAGSRAGAATYHVDPAGSDARDGLTPSTAWKSLTKVNATTFTAGDRILFARGGEWRGRLWPRSSGTAGNPIVFDTFGSGAKPIFWGSDPIANASFTPAGSGTYSCALPGLPAGQIYVLQDHRFLGTSAATYNAPILTIASSSDPRTDGKTYTVCVRGNVIYSNDKNHLVFRNLVVDETAGELDDGNNQGYGIRIQGSTGVLVEDCEAYRCGRHNIGVINSTAFIGRRITCAYAAPRVSGCNTIYVSYADANAPAASCVHEWIDCVSDHAESGDGGFYDAFTTHGPNQGAITFRNFRVNGGKVSLMAGPVLFQGGELAGMSRLESWSDNVVVDGTVLRDQSFVDQWANNGTFQNLVFANGTPSESGAFILRPGRSGNVIRFCTIALAGHECLAFYGAAPNTRWYGNIMLGTVTSGGNASDVAYADANFYSSSATIMGQSLSAWKASGKDASALSGVPQFTNQTAGDYTLQASSPCIDAAGAVAAANIPATDTNGNLRPSGGSADIGAAERTASGSGAPVITSPATANATIGAVFTYQITASNGPTSFTATGLPGWATVNGSGLITGTPTIPGSAAVVVGAANSTGSGSRTLSITIAPASPPGTTTGGTTTGSSSTGGSTSGSSSSTGSSSTGGTTATVDTIDTGGTGSGAGCGLGSGVAGSALIMSLLARRLFAVGCRRC
ncbi:MAG: hypothetical protein H0V44_02270 [Planctomycetes bacterium]|nr:hypothetical protein [Planctomycetota bacterium]